MTALPTLADPGELSVSCLDCHHTTTELVPKNWTDGLALDLISNTRERIRRR